MHVHIQNYKLIIIRYSIKILPHEGGYFIDYYLVTIYHNVIHF